MPYYGLFWTRSPYLDLRWRSCSTGTLLELLITSIVWHKNKNRWLGDPLWRSCSLFCVVIFHSSFRPVKYPYTKQFTWSPQWIPPSPVLVIIFVLCLITMHTVHSRKYTSKTWFVHEYRYQQRMAIQEYFTSNKNPWNWQTFIKT